RPARRRETAVPPGTGPGRRRPGGARRRKSESALRPWRQNGAMLRKKRCSQPIVWTSSITPLLRYSMRASATWVEDTVLLPVIERGSTTPERSEERRVGKE